MVATSEMLGPYFQRTGDAQISATEVIQNVTHHRQKALEMS